MDRFFNSYACLLLHAHNFRVLGELNYHDAQLALFTRTSLVSLEVPTSAQLL